MSRNGTTLEETLPARVFVRRKEAGQEGNGLLTGWARVDCHTHVETILGSVSFARFVMVRGVVHRCGLPEIRFPRRVYVNVVDLVESYP